MSKKALILIADGTEEMEFTITYDTLVRAGVECTSANAQSGGSPYGSVGTSPALVVCSRGVKILPDTTLHPRARVRCVSSRDGPYTLDVLSRDQDKYDALIVPGGMKGAETLVRAYYEASKIVGMICAGTLAAKTAGLPCQPVTSHPVVKHDLVSVYDYKEEAVVVSNAVPGKGTLVTSRGPGTAFSFALTLVELLCGRARREQVGEPMMLC